MFGGKIHILVPQKSRCAMVKTWSKRVVVRHPVLDSWIDDHPPIFWGNQHVFWRRDYDSLRFKFWNIHDFPKKPEWFMVGSIYPETLVWFILPTSL